MKPIIRNTFFIFGFVCIIYILHRFGVDFNDFHTKLRKAGLYLPAVIGIWVIVYAFNAGAFYQIVNSDSSDKHLSYRNAYKLTISGFAFSYTTPFGFGGAPYRVMELSSYIGSAKAMSCTFLYSMMHILSHFYLWLTGCILFVVLYHHKMTPLYWILLGIFLLVCAIVFYFFYYGYKNGMIIKSFHILLKIPFLKRYIRKIYDKKKEHFEQMDVHIAYLHSKPRKFYSALAMEYIGRILNSLEFYFILLSIGIPISFSDAIIILAFSSLIGNIFFFFPMQLGAREGGLAIIIEMLGFGALSIGVFTSFYTRIREIFWIIIGVVLIKIGTKNIMK